MLHLRSLMLLAASNTRIESVKQPTQQHTNKQRRNEQIRIRIPDLLPQTKRYRKWNLGISSFRGIEPDVNRTRNLLIWSQTRYHCATDPNGDNSSVQFVFINFNIVLLSYIFLYSQLGFDTKRILGVPKNAFPFKGWQ